METIIAMILAGATIAYVGYPLLKSDPEAAVEPEAEGPSVEEELDIQKEATFAAISELDFDHAMGNLSDKDHDELRDRYKLKALALIKEMDELEKAAAAANPPVRRAVSQPSVEVARSKAFCSGCGAGLSHDDRFCRGCGKPLSQGCPSCGTPYDPADAFCALCGEKL